MQALIQVILQCSLMLLILGVGLQSSWSDLAYVWRRPALLLRGFVAVNVIVPLSAIILCLLFPSDRLTKAGIIIMAVSPLAPFVIGKMIKAGADRSYVVGTYSALIAASVVVIPVTFELIELLVGRDTSVPVAMVAKFVLQSVALPLVFGVAIATWFQELARRAAPIARSVALVGLVPIFLLIVYRSGAAAVSLVGDGSLAVIVLTVAAGIAAGHWLGGSDPARRTALAQAAATRHPGIAAMIANRHFDDKRVMLAVILFLLSSIVVSAIYSKWITSRAAKMRMAASAVQA